LNERHNQRPLYLELTCSTLDESHRETVCATSVLSDYTKNLYTMSGLTEIIYPRPA